LKVVWVVNSLKVGQSLIVCIYCFSRVHPSFQNPQSSPVVQNTRPGFPHSPPIHTPDLTGLTPATRRAQARIRITSPSPNPSPSPSPSTSTSQSPISRRYPTRNRRAPRHFDSSSPQIPPPPIPSPPQFPSLTQNSSQGSIQSQRQLMNRFPLQQNDPVQSQRSTPRQNTPLSTQESLSTQASQPSQPYSILKEETNISEIQLRVSIFSLQIFGRMSYNPLWMNGDKS
jgi:hypothetical protein